jgi:hypothetical protein
MPIAFASDALPLASETQPKLVYDITSSSAEISNSVTPFGGQRSQLDVRAGDGRFQVIVKCAGKTVRHLTTSLGFFYFPSRSTNVCNQFERIENSINNNWGVKKSLVIDFASGTITIENGQNK